MTFNHAVPRSLSIVCIVALLTVISTVVVEATSAEQMKVYRKIN